MLITLIRKGQALAQRLLGDERGNVLTLFALALPVVIGMLGLGIEGASWYQLQRAEQNAADAAAVAAANNGGSSTYNLEAAAVATLYGYTNNSANTTVTSSNAATCPAGGTNCYSVTISRLVPLSLSTIVGFRGDSTVNGARAITITATAIATQTSTPRQYCIVALAQTSTAAVDFQTNGAPKADLTGCNIMANSNMVCNGHNLNATYGDAHGSNNGCGITEEDNVPLYVDPYAALASNIPANTCSSYPQEPAHNNGTALPASNQISGSYAWTGNQTFCGDVQLTGNVTLTGSATTVVIRNGQLDTNGYTIKTASGATATLVFSGDNTSGYTHAPTGGGTIDITAPTSGVWSGIALYQDPAITNGADISAAGNSPTWDITGLVYLPNSNVTFSGAVNKSSNGNSCFAMVANTILINGTADILAQGQCSQAGLNMPTNNLTPRGKLVA